MSNSLRMAAWWRAGRPYGIALAIFLGSRGVVALAIAFASVYVPRAAGEFWDAGASWYHRLLRWDTGWYATVIDNGYLVAANSEHAKNAAFYPLYPLLAKAVMLLGLDKFNALLIVANIASLSAALLFFKLVRDEHGDDTGYLSVAFLGFFPTSFFLSAGYAESLTLTLMVGCMLLLRRGAIVAAAAVAGLALASRSTGIVLLPVVLLHVWKAHRSDAAALLRQGLIAALLATSGLTIYMAYLWIAVGDPFRFATSMVYWHGTSQWQRLAAALTLRPQMYSFTEGFFYFAGPIALLVVFWRRIESSQAILALGVLMLPYLTLAGGTAGYVSMPRYALLAFPIFIILALLCKGRPWIAVSIAAIGSAGLLAGTARFSQWYWAG